MPLNTPPERIAHIPADNRTYPVPTNNRTIIVPDNE